MLSSGGLGGRADPCNQWNPHRPALAQLVTLSFGVMPIERRYVNMSRPRFESIRHCSKPAPSAVWDGRSQITKSVVDRLRIQSAVVATHSASDTAAARLKSLRRTRES
jgi:hypothetical protein